MNALAAPRARAPGTRAPAAAARGDERRSEIALNDGAGQKQVYRTPPTSHTMHLRISAARGAPAAAARRAPASRGTRSRPTGPTARDRRRKAAVSVYLYTTAISSNNMYMHAYASQTLYNSPRRKQPWPVACAALPEPSPRRRWHRPPRAAQLGSRAAGYGARRRRWRR